MPTLPSGRRVEFSLDRFHALLNRLPPQQARQIAGNLVTPDDLLYVMDAVHFSLAAGEPFFAGYVAADWVSVAADWSTADRQGLQAWFASAEAREARAGAIDYIRGAVFDGAMNRMPYPYLVQWGRDDAVAASRLRQ